MSSYGSVSDLSEQFIESVRLGGSALGNERNVTVTERRGEQFELRTFAITCV